MKIRTYLNRIRENRVFWPLVALVLILVFDAFYAPGFFKIGILEGHLYGNIIDVINDGAPLMLVAVGFPYRITPGGGIGESPARGFDMESKYEKEIG